MPTPIRLRLTATPGIGPSDGRRKVRLLLGNPGEEDVLTPLPERWEATVKARVIRPDGSEENWAPFAAHPLASRDQPSLLLYAESDRSAEFSLPGRWLREAGVYRVSATIEFGEESLGFPEAEFRVEGVSGLELAIPPIAGWDEETVIDAWVLLRGESNCYLRRVPVEISEERGIPKFGIFEEVALLPAGSRAVTTSGEWLTWLGGESFHAGATLPRFLHGEARLPATPARILPGQRAVVLAASGLEMWVMDIVAGIPEVVEDEDGAQWTKAQAPAIGVSMTVKLPDQALGAALGEDGIAVVCANSDGTGLDVWFAPSLAAAVDGRWKAVHLRGARALAGADPLLTEEAEGGTRVSILVVTPDAAASNGRAGVVHLGFDRNGEPAYWPGLGWERPWPLEAESVSGVLQSRSDTERQSVRFDWCVTVAGGAILARLGGGAPIRGRLSRPVLQPLRLFGFAERLLVAMTDGNAVYFETIQGQICSIS